MSKLYHLEKLIKGSYTSVVSMRRSLYQTKYGRWSSTLPYKKWSPEKLYQSAYRKNCENVIGFTSIPVGLVGPLRINDRRRFLPIATTEGALVASMNRGCKLLRGVDVHVKDVGMTRAPLIAFENIKAAGKFCEWLSNNTKMIKILFEETSQHSTLQNVTAHQCGRDIHLKFRATTDDAMGMNIVTKGCNTVLHYIKEQFPNIKIISLSGNYCTDKKVAATNWVSGRGKSVIAEAKLYPRDIQEILGCTGKDLLEINVKKNLVGSAFAGALGGFNAQAANVVAGLYAAMGQDLGQIGTSSTCITQIDQNPDNTLTASVTMPNVEVGIVGGGTGLPSQSEALKIAAVESSIDLASLVGAGVLAGELSLLGSLCRGDLLDAHLKLNRK
uniref:hydroxymethylglutaryl-CoA reductase (NADPH) n=1 Tax=Marseillevirus LCMAC201 TaxID=2506605 RepID=A0A481YXA4_9VIRU|nr:MAG: hydroxymethylglutaryl-coenzyme A reductase [Marseillevirus LCMAC201]